MANKMGIVDELLGETCTEEWNIRARGFRGGVDPLKYVFPLQMVQLVSMFFLSRALHFLLRPLKQPKFVANILAGIILGPSVLGNFNIYKEKMIQPRETTVLHIISNIGVYYLIFILSVKMDITMILRTSGKKVWTIGGLSLFLPLLTTMFLTIINFKFDLASDVNMGKRQVLQGCLLLSVTAFPQVAQSLSEINLLTSELGNLAMSCAVVNDIIRMCILLVVATTVKIQIHGRAAIFKIVGLTLLLFCLRRVPLWINKNTPEGKPVKENYIVGILAGVLFIGMLSQDVLGSPAIGVMVFGLIIPDGPPLGATLANKTELMLSEFLMPSFFVEVGLNMNVTAKLLVDNWKLFVTYGWFAGLLMVAKLLGCFLPAAFIFKMSYRSSFLLGLVMNFKGVIEASGFTYWRYASEQRKPIDDQNYAALVFAATGFTALVTPLITLLYKPKERLDKPGKHPKMRTIQAASTTGELRVLLCIHEEDNVGSIIALLEASNPTSEGPINASVVHLIELVGRDAPLLVPYDKRGPLWKSPKTAQIMKAFENYSKYAHGRVAIHPFTLVAPFKSMHELICRLSQDKSCPLIIVPFDQERGGLDGGAEENAAKLRNLNSNLQKNAPCTVGILVNRGLNDVVRYEHFSYHIAVVFFGGADDREALAYAIRMSGHPNVSITVLRIHITDERTDEYNPERKVERQLDDTLVDEFKRKNVNNACALYRGEVVEDIVHAINLIKSLGNNYDLVMVGRRRNLGADREMDSWNENPELGVIGDMLASPEYFGGMVSVLVMQHYGEVDRWWSRSP